MEKAATKVANGCRVPKHLTNLLTSYMRKRDQWSEFFDKFAYPKDMLVDSLFYGPYSDVAILYWGPSLAIGCKSNYCKLENRKEKYFHVCVMKPYHIRGSVPFEIGGEGFVIKFERRSDSKQAIFLNLRNRLDKT